MLRPDHGQSPIFLYPYQGDCLTLKGRHTKALCNPSRFILNSSQNISHGISTAFPLFGHIRLAIGVICKLIQLDRNLVFTFLAAKLYAPVVKQEIDSWALDPSDRGRIRLIGLGQTEKPAQQSMGFFAQVLSELGPQLRDTYDVLVKKGSLTCTSTGETFDYSTIPTPRAVVIDTMTPPEVAEHIKGKSPRVKLIALFPGRAFGTLPQCGPMEDGGRYEWEAQTKALVDVGIRSHSTRSLGASDHRRRRKAISVVRWREDVRL